MSQDIPRGAPGHRPGVQQAVPQDALKNGMLVYFDSCKKTAHRKGMRFNFRGHGFGILLGVTPVFGKEPTRDQVIALLGGVGFVLLDDVADILGDDAAAKFVEGFQARYAEKAEEKPAIEEPPPPQILGADGEPLAPKEPEAQPIAEKESDA